MKTLTLLCGGALLWAQSVQLDLSRFAPRGTVSLRMPNSAPALRTTSLPWLQPNQDFTTVPNGASDPDYAGDTLISNGTGPNTRSNPPAACVGTFFDSLEQAAAYLLVSNERFKLGPGVSSLGIAPYYDGAIAERYDITPDKDGVNRTVTIKGIALLLLNYLPANPCSPSLADPSPGQGASGYTYTYALYQASPYSYGSPFYTPARQGTIPNPTSVRSVSKTLDQVQLGNLLLNNTGPQCPPATSSITELFDFVYFPTPLDITDSASYYVVVSTERYNINTYSLTDTIYFLYGPSSASPIPSHPCFNGDTVRLGRSLISWAFYDTTASGGDFYGTPSSLSSSLPDWLPTHLFGPPIDQGLNFVAFPIVYAQDIVTGVWIRGGNGEILTPYPNPTTDCFHLKVRTPAASTLQLVLHSLDGRTVKVWPVRPLEAGENVLAVDVADVPAGTYLLRARSEAVQAAFQVTILH
ncbi:MAG: hypothetical protein KatS3mg026_0801 [Bacteroidia bacterium]|nr:MAG: hypothetical protein KatS3mg026_0801 [Bacteroidia bacterium]